MTINIADAIMIKNYIFKETKTMKQNNKLPLKLPNKFASQIYYHYEPGDKEAEGDTLLRVYGAGLAMKNPDYGQTHIPTSSSFEYILEGKGFIEIEGRRYEVKAGDCVITRIGLYDRIVKSYGSSKEDPYVKLWLISRGRFIDSLFEAFGVTDRVIVRKINLYPVFQKFMSRLQTGGYSFSLATHTILDIMNAMFSGKVETEQDGDSLVWHIKHYIESRFREELTLSGTASAFGMNENAFKRFFLKNFGTTFAKYVASEKLEYAKNMLENTDLTVTEIARDLGFCDQSYFSARFKRTYGCYPSEYKKRHL